MISLSFHKISLFHFLSFQAMYLKILNCLISYYCSKIYCSSENPQKENIRQKVKMGCEESSICFSGKHNTGRSKAGTIKKTVKYAERPKTKKNIESLDQGEYELTEEDWDMVQTILLNHQLLFKARGYANKEIMNRLQNFEATVNQVIFKKGDPSSYFYIIISGSIRISDWAEGENSKILHRGSYFGDLGIYSKAARSATATAETTSYLVGLKKENFLRISLQLSKKAQAQVFSYIKNIPMFKQLNLHQKHRIAYLAQELRFKAKTVIFKKGEVSSCLYVVKSGKVLLTIPERDPVEVKVKQGFGESCLNEAHPERYADATCLQPTILLAFSKTDIQKHIGKEFLDVEIVNKFMWALKHDKNLKVSPLIMESMIELKEIRMYQDKEVIMQRGEPIKHFIISLEGGINNNPELQVFNTDYLLDIKYHTERLVKTESGRVALINIQAIEKRYNRSFNTLIDLNQTIWKQIESVNKIQQYVANLTLEHFRVIDTKSIGDYGATLKIKSDSNIQFAMRVIDKSKALQEEMQYTIISLKNVGGKLTHPLIAKQYRIFADKYRLYFMARWVEGEDLYDLVDRQKKLSSNIVKHFAACIINIMEYIHCRRIVWRELKIESFVVDSQGYLTLVDLMHLQELPPDHAYIDNPNKATFLYLAPEVISSQGHGLQTDFWSLGVVIYRMLVGEFPYGQNIVINEEDQILQLISRQIQTKPLVLPNWLTSDAKIILKLLLNPQPFERSLISFTKLKKMSFFKDYDWLGLIEKKVKTVPYLPKKVVPKCPEPISVLSWIEHQHSVLPPFSILDEI